MTSETKKQEKATPVTKKPTTQFYLKNRTLIKNIHLSKNSFNWYADGTIKTTKFSDYDIIMCDHDTYEGSRKQLILQLINRMRYESGKNRTSNISDEDFESVCKESVEESVSRLIKFDPDKPITEDMIYRIKLGYHNKRLYESNKNREREITPERAAEIDIEDCVIRVFSFEHIPLNPKKIIKKIADNYEALNFPPFRHYVIRDGKFECVALSHHTKDKVFSTTHGQINNDLAQGILLICRRYAQSHNWRGYSYTDDMQGHAVLQLTQVGLQFNELFSENVFSYYTQSIKNAFTIVFNKEKETQMIRDNLLMEQMKSPSWTRQLQLELSNIDHWNGILEKDTEFDSVDIDVEEYNEDTEMAIDVEPEIDYSNTDDMEDYDLEIDEDQELLLD